MTERDDRGWDAGWEAHELAQRRRMARIPLIEKLEWLEAAHRVARHLRRPDRIPRTWLDDPRERAPES